MICRSRNSLPFRHPHIEDKFVPPTIPNFNRLGIKMTHFPLEEMILTEKMKYFHFEYSFDMNKKGTNDFFCNLNEIDLKKISQKMISKKKKISVRHSFHIG